ncbi:MAG: hypothetical protein Q9190_006291 [Brigantiaea leucoxantha]
MSSLLPSHPGLLPYWQLLLSTLAIFNTVIVYISKDNALRTYTGPHARHQVTDLTSRLFGTWNALAGVVRLLAAYNIDDRAVYMLSLATYVIALAHFSTEWWIFGTTQAGPGMWRILPFPVITITWMILQWDFYVGE